MKLDKNGATLWLQRHGVARRAIAHVIDGFEFSDPRYPVYEQQIEVGTILFQYIRNPDFTDLGRGTGNWFSLAGAHKSDLIL